MHEETLPWSVRVQGAQKAVRFDRLHAPHDEEPRLFIGLAPWLTGKTEHSGCREREDLACAIRGSNDTRRTLTDGIQHHAESF